MTKTCMQKVIDRRTHLVVSRRRPHIVPAGTGDPNNGYARCASCGAEIYVGSGLHPNLGGPADEVEQ